MDFTSVNFKGTVFLFGGYQAAVSEAVWTMKNETFEFHKVVRTDNLLTGPLIRAPYYRT